MKIETPRIWLPRTGQTTSYADGDDGDLQAGNPRATRFVDNGNGTVSDRATGLTWVKQPELIIPGAVGIHATNQIQRARATWKVPPDDALGDYVAGDLVVGDGAPDALFYVCILGHAAHADKEPPNATYWRETGWTASAADLTTPSTVAWADAVANCLALEYAGFDDWRLPNILELASIYDWSISLVFVPFVGETLLYWSSTTYSNATTYAKYVSFYSGNIGHLVKTVGNELVRPVRGGRING